MPMSIEVGPSYINPEFGIVVGYGNLEIYPPAVLLYALNVSGVIRKRSARYIRGWPHMPTLPAIRFD